MKKWEISTGVCYYGFFHLSHSIMELEKNIHKYYNDPEFEAFRRITPFSTKVNFYIWGIIVIGGSIFLIITLSMVVLYQFGIID